MFKESDMNNLIVKEGNSIKSSERPTVTWVITKPKANKLKGEILGEVTYLRPRTGEFIVFKPAQTGAVKFKIHMAHSTYKYGQVEVLEADAGKIENGNLILDGVAGEMIKVKVKLRNDIQCPIIINMQLVA